ncbi:MAG: bifunctional precorrin-2 dehydrogenase/sirohydrochlorin ferrochelatase [Halobaculum sp.]
MIPLLHDFTGERVLVVGGGAVGARKARKFAREAHVIVLGPEFGDRSFEADGGTGETDLVRAAPEPDDISDWVERVDPALVVAATDVGAVNAAAERAAHDHGALVNRADHSGDREAGSVVVPATIRDDPVIAALATGGTAPALSRYLRQQVEVEIEGAGAMAEVLGTIRAELKRRDLPESTRREAILSVLESSSVWKALQAEPANGMEEARRIVQEITQ